jgi:hypothetical protein
LRALRGISGGRVSEISYALGKACWEPVPFD